MAQGAVTVSSENRYRRVLVALAILAQEIVLENIVAAAQEPQVVPPSLAGMCSQGCRIGRRYYDEVEVLGKMMSSTVQAILLRLGSPRASDSAK